MDLPHKGRSGDVARLQAEKGRFYRAVILCVPIG
jgi:hypothetical protein